MAESRLINVKKCKKKDIEYIFGVSGTTVYNWVKNNGCPKDDKTYDLKAVMEWYIDYRIDTNNVADEKSVEEIRKMKLQSRKLELQIEEINKTTISISEHKTKMYEMATCIKRYFTDQWKVDHMLDMNEIDCRCPVSKYLSYQQKKINEMMNTFSHILEIKEI